MTNLVLFHHIQGLTPGVVALADRFRAAGHTVSTPDLFEGRTFTSIDEGFGYLQEVGFGAMVARASDAVAGLPEALVYAGVSMGVMAAQSLVQSRPGALGLLAYESFAPVEEFGAWPDGVPAQAHGMADDAFFVHEGDVEHARALAATGADVEIFLYPGSGHLFVDSSLAAYDDAATDLVVQRSLALLDRVGR